MESLPGDTQNPDVDLAILLVAKLTLRKTAHSQGNSVLLSHGGAITNAQPSKPSDELDSGGKAFADVLEMRHQEVDLAVLQHLEVPLQATKVQSISNHSGKQPESVQQWDSMFASYGKTARSLQDLRVPETVPVWIAPWSVEA